MKIRVRLLALLKEAAGVETLELNIAGDELKIEELLRKVVEAAPGLGDALELLKKYGVKPVVMVNGKIVGPEHKVRDGDEVALMPPASGG